jgi:hypothetical protein
LVENKKELMINNHKLLNAQKDLLFYKKKRAVKINSAALLVGHLGIEPNTSRL